MRCPTNAECQASQMSLQKFCSPMAEAIQD